MPLGTITTDAMAAQFVELLGDHGVTLTDPSGFATDFSAMFTAWMGGEGAIPADLSQRVATAAGAWNADAIQRIDWWTGAIDGGPNGDGLYPMINAAGVTTLFPSLAKILDSTAKGNAGWSPRLTSEADGTTRVVWKVTDWTGGQGTKPATGYIAADGSIVGTAAAAYDFFGVISATLTTLKSAAETARAGAETAAASVVGTISRSTPGFKDWRRTWTDQYGRLAAGVRKTGAFFMNRMEALTGTVGSLQATTLTTSSTTIGPSTTTTGQFKSYVWARLDRYGRILIAGLTDGSVRISKLRDAAGALVYPQIIAAAAAASAAATSATLALTQIAAVTSILSRSTPGFANWRRAWTDQFGRLAAGIKKSGAFFANRFEALSATVTSLSAVAISTSSVTIGFASRVLSSSRSFLSVTTDRYGRIMQGGRTDGSVQISKLRDGSGALVYPQVAQAKSDAAAALVLAGVGGASAFRQKMVAAQAASGRWPKPWMTTPPTLTLTSGSPGAPSGTILVPWNSTGKWTTEGGYTSQFGGNAFLQWKTLSQTGNANGFNACNGCAVNTVHTGADLHLLFRGSGASVRVLVNNQYVSLTKSSSTGDGLGWRLSIDFAGVTATRKITIEADGNFQFGGFYLRSGDSLTAPTIVKPKIVALGSSITEGGAPNLPMGGYAFWLARRLGVDLWDVGLGGAGIINPGTSPRVKQLDRSQDYTAGSFDMAIDENGINDTGSSLYTGSDPANIEREFGDEYRRNLDLWFAAHPNAPWIAFGPYWPTGTPTTNCYRVRDAKWKVCAEYPLTAFIDTLTPANIISGLGKEGATTGTGTGDLYTVNDGTHQSILGAQFTGGQYLFDQVDRLIRTRF
jgi:hypothetical protein